MEKINFLTADIQFRLYHKNKIRKWINFVLDSEKIKIPVIIDFIFCSDPFLLKINKAYLNHDAFTDIISFNLSDNNQVLTGEVYISIDRVKENHIIFGNSLENELNRVIVHGILHLLGYKDKSPKEIQIMRGLENKYLNNYK